MDFFKKFKEHSFLSWKWWIIHLLGIGSVYALGVLARLKNLW